MLFNPFNPLANSQKTTRAPIPIAIHPYFYNVLDSTSLQTSTTINLGQSSTTTATTTAATTLPPNFCRTSADCGMGSCCRDMNNQVIVMSEVFDATGNLNYFSLTIRTIPFIVFL